MAATTNYSLVVLENPLLDIQVVGSPELLQKYSLKSDGTVLASPEQMEIFDEILQSHNPSMLAGGAAQNSARGAQYILPPSSVLYIGCVGQDRYAEILRAEAERAGIAVEYNVDPSTATGKCAVIISGSDRSLCTDLGAANNYKLDHLKSDKIWAHVTAAKMYFIGGYHLTVSPESIMAIAEHAATSNKPFVLSISAEFIPVAFKSVFQQSLLYADYLIGNEAEALACSSALGLKSKTAPDIAAELAVFKKVNIQRPRTVVITQGTQPTVVACSDTSSVQEYPVSIISPEKLKDTNGAGDAFAGGFLAGLLQNKPIHTAVEMGHWLAGLSVQQTGPSFPYPKVQYTSS